MARVQAKLVTDEQAWNQADKVLLQLHADVKGRAIANAMRSVATKLNRRVRGMLPKPGYPGDKPDLKPLRDTLKVRTKNYQDGDIKIVISGYDSKEGAHGHLVEGGHDIVVGGPKKKGGVVVGYVQPYEYLIAEAEASKLQQSAELVAYLRQFLTRDGVRG